MEELSETGKIVVAGCIGSSTNQHKQHEFTFIGDPIEYSVKTMTYTKVVLVCLCCAMVHTIIVKR